MNEAPVGTIFQSIHDQYYQALKRLDFDDEPFMINPMEADVTVTNVETTTSQGGLKAFIVTGNYKYVATAQNALTRTLVAPPSTPAASGDTSVMFAKYTTKKYDFNKEIDTLALMIKNAAISFVNTPNLGPLNDHQFTLDLTFSYNNDGTVSINWPLSSVFGLTASYEKSFQSGNEIKLKFDVIKKEQMFSSRKAYEDAYKSKGFETFNDKLETKDLPDKMTLDAPPPRVQGNLNSCVGWAIGYTYLSTVWKEYLERVAGDTSKKLAWTEDLERSPNFIYDQLQEKCSTINIQAALDQVIKYGDCSVTTMPIVNDCSKLAPPTHAQIAAAQEIKGAIGNTWHNLDPNDIDQIKLCLANHRPVIVAFYMSQSFKDMWFNGNHIWSSVNSPYSSGHCVCIIGYDNATQMFKVQNQWDTSKCLVKEGYFYVTYDMVKSGCFREAYIFY
ncbi:C1 family peptidase [Mucilaginibacter sp. X4EP1]|uniref:C1 family peptidase n=1 Tax=Mucilaginibacter sp. X4EP1 TaxID=2723092 RepID=UPI002169C347|nr:C1 family peptidase [Mucilaginibacter sp. X4EP1]MCS3815510.1 hypothetical protein [Mucilaginibacter sp. X4EP1]